MIEKGEMYRRVRRFSTPRNENESQNDKERGDRGGGAVVETNDARRLAKVLTLRLAVISTRG